MNIAFHKPWYDAADEQALVSVLRSGKLVGDGENTKNVSERLQSLLGVQHALLTPSCTHALELAMMVLDLRPGDEVIVPSFTFVSTTNCILREGATVVFADILPSTLTIDVDDLKKKVSSRTRAIIPVCYAGVAPEMDTIMSVARERKMVVIEDAAQGLGATYNGKPQGSIGDIGCFSFHETKNISTGEGGAFVTSNSAFAARAEIIREKGTNRKQFILGLVDKYTWMDVGSSYLPPDSTGAILGSQLDKLGAIQKRRSGIYERYIEAFSPLVSGGLLTPPNIPSHTQSNYQIFHILLKDELTRNEAIRFFRSKGIGTSFHYLPLHLSPVGQRLGYKTGDFPVTESVSGRLLRLPIYPSLSEEEQEYVISTMKEFFQ